MCGNYGAKVSHEGTLKKHEFVLRERRILVDRSNQTGLLYELAVKQLPHNFDLQNKERPQLSIYRSCGFFVHKRTDIINFDDDKFVLCDSRSLY
jgi:hypothetical protein